MATSIYDFDTRFEPFEAFESIAPFAPFAFPIMLAAPLGWWADAMLSAYSAWWDATISAMVYPYEWPQSQTKAGG